MRWTTPCATTTTNFRLQISAPTAKLFRQVPNMAHCLFRLETVTTRLVSKLYSGFAPGPWRRLHMPSRGPLRLKCVRGRPHVPPMGASRQHTLALITLYNAFHHILPEIIFPPSKSPRRLDRCTQGSSGQEHECARVLRYDSAAWAASRPSNSMSL